MILDALNFVADVIIITFAIWVGVQYYRVKNWILVKIKEMDLDKIISDTLETDIEKKEPDTLGSALIPNQHAHVEGLRERLIGVAFVGKSKEFLGKTITSEEIKRLDREAILKLYARYENRMGGLVTKSLKKHFVSAYTNALGLVLPKNLRIADREAL